MGNLRFVVFQLIAYRIYSVYGVILHFLRLPVDVNSLQNLVTGLYYEWGGERELFQSGICHELITRSPVRSSCVTLHF